MTRQYVFVEDADQEGSWNTLVRTSGGSVADLTINGTFDEGSEFDLDGWYYSFDWSMGEDSLIATEANFSASRSGNDISNEDAIYAAVAYFNEDATIDRVIDWHLIEFDVSSEEDTRTVKVSYPTGGDNWRVTEQVGGAFVIEEEAWGWLPLAYIYNIEDEGEGWYSYTTNTDEMRLTSEVHLR